MDGSAEPDSRNARSTWHTWLEHPEKLWLRQALFQIHYWMGAMLGLYVALMSHTGTILVYGNELAGWTFVRRLANLHENLMGGGQGRVVNGIGAICLTLLGLTGAIIWWPGLKNWRRSLTIDRRVRFARMNWDLHSALGFWSMLFVLLWGVSAIYFCFPRWFDGLYLLDPADRSTDFSLHWLSQLHFGRFNRLTEVVWTVFGLVPAVLAFTGTFVCCRRIIFKKPSNPWS